MARQRTIAPTPWYSRFGNAAQIASALVALVGFTAVVWQINEAKEKSLQESYRSDLADARKIYMSYSDAALQYPRLSEPDYDALMRDHFEYVRYQNFVSHMLYAYDEILHVAALVDSVSEDEWGLAFEIDIEPHHRFICQMPDLRVIKTYRAAMQARLAKAREHCEDTKPLTQMTQASAR